MEQRVLGCVSSKGYGMGVRRARVEHLGFFAARQKPLHSTDLWEGKGVPISLLQGCRKHLQRGYSAKQSCQIQDSLARCISTGRRKETPNEASELFLAAASHTGF